MERVDSNGLHLLSLVCSGSIFTWEDWRDSWPRCRQTPWEKKLLLRESMFTWIFVWCSAHSSKSTIGSLAFHICINSWRVKLQVCCILGCWCDQWSCHIRHHRSRPLLLMADWTILGMIIPTTTKIQGWPWWFHQPRIDLASPLLHGANLQLGCRGWLRLFHEKREACHVNATWGTYPLMLHPVSKLIEAGCHRNFHCTVFVALDIENLERSVLPGSYMGFSGSGVSISWNHHPCHQWT